MDEIPWIKKSKKYLNTLVIFGGAFITAKATNLIDLNGQTTMDDVEKRTVKVPRNGYNFN